jgi:hypothetical protein
MITKRQLGFGLSGIGLIAAFSILAVDWLGAGDFQGIGPLQRITFAGATLLLVLGLTLIPLGNRPA